MTARTICKYPNRRLYDTEESRYITLADIRKHVIQLVRFPPVLADQFVLLRHPRAVIPITKPDGVSSSERVRRVRDKRHQADAVDRFLVRHS